jgi:predicted dinucleotide-binding enzyme
MRIWVIGADPLARALGRSWVQAGHQVMFSLGDRTDWDALAAETGGRLATPAEGATAQAVLLAAPWSAVGKALRMAGSLAGKVVLDATNPREPMVGPSGAEEVALRASGACGQGVQHGGRTGGRPGRRAGAAEPAVLR